MRTCSAPGIGYRDAQLQANQAKVRADLEDALQRVQRGDFDRLVFPVDASRGVNFVLLTSYFIRLTSYFLPPNSNRWMPRGGQPWAPVWPTCPSWRRGRGRCFSLRSSASRRRCRRPRRTPAGPPPRPRGRSSCWPHDVAGRGAGAAERVLRSLCCGAVHKPCDLFSFFWFQEVLKP